MVFRARVVPSGNAAGVEVPEEVVRSFQAGPRPPVEVSIHGHRWRTRIALMRGQILVGLSAANCAASGVKLGDWIEVELTLDEAPRNVDLPSDVAAALDQVPGARASFEGLAFGLRRKLIEELESSKTEETRKRRLQRLFELLEKRR